MISYWGAGVRLGGGRRPFDYYVDPTDGSDANDGRTPGRAFATVGAGVAALANGNRMGLKYGSTFAEECDLTGLSNITVGAWGSPGDGLPVLEGRDTAANGSFSKTVGQTNVYEISWTNEFDGTSNRHITVFEDGVRLIRAADLATCDATAGSFYTAGPTGAASTDDVYVHASDSSDVSANAKVYKITKRDNGVKNGWTVRNIKAVGFGSSGAGMIESKFAYDCEAEEGVVHNFLQLAGGRFERCISRNLEATATAGSGTHFVGYDAAASHFVFHACEAYGGTTANSAYQFGGTVGFFAHGTAEATSLTCTNCHVEDVLTAYGGGSSALLVVDQCKALQCRYGVAAGQTYTDESRVTGCFFQGTTSARTMQRGLSCTNGGKSGSTHTFEGNVVQGYSAQSGWVYCEETLICRYNTFDAEFAASNVQGWFSAQAGGTITISNNVFNGIERPYEHTGASTDAFTADNNVFFGFNDWRKDNTIHSTLGDMQSATGQDGSSLTTDPDFTNDPAGWSEVADAVTNAGSPAKTLGAGVEYYSGA